MGEVFGEEGRAWLERLPGLIEECARRWTLEVSPPFAPLSYNYVAPARREDGTPVVLKLGCPNPALGGEIEALRLYGGRGAVRLLEAETPAGALLLERLAPGAPLASVRDDEEATSRAAAVMRRLWRTLPPGHGFPPVRHWADGLERLRRRYEGGTGPFPDPLVERAERLFEELLETAEEAVLLHGDLHHENLLSASREPWLAIDPKGVAGEPACEVGAFLRNRLPPLDQPARVREVLARRLDLLSAELGIDRGRLLGWTAALAVLSAWWVVEDHGRGWEPALTLAQLIAALPD